MAAAIIALTSCAKDDTLRRFNVTMCNMTDGRLTSDQGNIFNVDPLRPKKQLQALDMQIKIQDGAVDLSGEAVLKRIKCSFEPYSTMSSSLIFLV